MRLPEEKDYERFIQGFAVDLSREHPDVCFYMFGSLVDGRPDWGRSDIDGGLILGKGIITDKRKLGNISQYFAHHVSRTGVPIQFNLQDRVTDADGRLLSFTTDYTAWFCDPIHASVVCGPDFVTEMNGLDYKSGGLYAAAFNFRKVRNGVLTSWLDYTCNHQRFRKNVQSAVSNAAKLPKKLLFLRGGALITDPGQAANGLQGMLDGVDFDFLGKATALLRDPERFLRETADPSTAFDWLYGSLDLIEQMVGAYIRKFPEHCDAEHR